VWLPDEGVHGILVSYGAYVSTVRYYKDKIKWEVILDNDEFEILSSKDDSIDE
jgi:hypothetical protein